MLRDAHPKMHGCVHGVFAVLPGLDPDLKVGLFGESRSYPAWVRFSNQNNGVSPDSKPDIRGVAIKLMGVGGTKLIDSDSGCTTHDFILISDNRFVTKDVAEFDGLVKGMMGGLVRLAWYFLTHPRVLRNLVTSLKKFANPLDIRYFSVAPYLLGARAVKYSLMPQRVEDAAVPAHAGDDYLMQAMVDRLSSGRKSQARTSAAAKSTRHIAVQRNALDQKLIVYYLATSDAESWVLAKSCLRPIEMSLCAPDHSQIHR